ncbi:hypothetical protein Scep_007351 [Stephania cephalantha]|uniref:Uncharacterized protein n=1 Tax=Stephania cephalantha TaxID=152367 RepID=A0AAP0KBN8_9MAGN
MYMHPVRASSRDRESIYIFYVPPYVRASTLSRTTHMGIVLSPPNVDVYAPPGEHAQRQRSHIHLLCLPPICAARASSASTHIWAKYSLSPSPYVQREQALRAHTYGQSTLCLPPHMCCASKLCEHTHMGKVLISQINSNHDSLANGLTQSTTISTIAIITTQ